MDYIEESALEHLNPADLTYQQWVDVGMALKQAGHPCEVWDEWSRADSRYHPGECAKKWNTFRGSPSPLTMGTVVKMAKDHGWKSPGMESFGWDDEIVVDAPAQVIDAGWLEGREISMPAFMTLEQQVEQMVTYLRALFREDDHVGYVVTAMERESDRKPVPSDVGSYAQTAGEIIRKLETCGGDIGQAIGDLSTINGRPAGAWIRFNPLDGNGVKNSNVTEFRYALVESDSIPVEKQDAIIRELELPVAVLVHSGGKSLHAIVHIDAPDYDEYKRRVDFLYQVCEKNGLKVDTQNKNPSRLSRLPGVQRGDQWQFIVDAGIGKSGWDEWKEYWNDLNDDLPDLQNLGSLWDSMPELTPPLIDGILRKGHKMLISGPSKAGKSFALIELTIAIAEGHQWLGFLCSKGRVAYINLELDGASCLHRFRDVYQARGWDPANIGSIDIWNLRGKAKPMDKLAGPLIRRARKGNYSAIIIDPIYKVITGDENAADKMAEFCNYFDRVCTELNCAVIYCHHHSKGAQAGKRSMDRASGSGVFARDPDALLDLLELSVKPEVAERITDTDVSGYCREQLKGAGLLEQVPQEQLYSAASMEQQCARLLPQRAAEIMGECARLRREIEAMTAFRVECTLREFPPAKPTNVWFRYPLHRLDDSGLLEDARPAGDYQGNRFDNRENLNKRKTGKELEEEWLKRIDETFDLLTAATDGQKGRNSVPTTEMAKALDTSVKTLCRYLEKSESLMATVKSERGLVVRK